MSDTVLARRPARAVSVQIQPDDAQPAPAAPLGERLRAVPAGIQGIWVGLVCIALLVGSAGAMRSLFDPTMGIAPGAPSAPSSTAPSPTASSPLPGAKVVVPTGRPQSAPPTPSTSGGPAAAPTVPPGLSALALRDRMSAHVHQRQVGAFLDDLDALLAMDPTVIDRDEVRKMIGDACAYAMVPSLSGDMSPEATRVFDFVTGRAGAAGPDILYDLMTTRGGSRAAAYAEELLKRDEVRAKGTPAFKIAYEMRSAPSCAVRKGLFPRAKTEGDRRVLGSLFQMARCGKGPNDCCMGNDAAYKEMVRVINEKKK